MQVVAAVPSCPGELYYCQLFNRSGKLFYNGWLAGEQ